MGALAMQLVLGEILGRVEVAIGTVMWQGVAQMVKRFAEETMVMLAVRRSSYVSIEGNNRCYSSSGSVYTICCGWDWRPNVRMGSGLWRGRCSSLVVVRHLSSVVRHSSIHFSKEILT